MAISYNPKDAEYALPAGEYVAELMSCQEKTSQAGNPMLVLNWNVMDSERDIIRKVRDYIPLPSGIWKIKKLAAAMGRLKEFEAATFQPEDHVGSTIRVMLKVDQQLGFPDKNSIGQYVTPGVQSKVSPSVTHEARAKAEASAAEEPGEAFEPEFAETPELDAQIKF